jgi:hypothetical protein
VAIRYSDHALQRLRERRLPREAVVLVIADPESTEVLDEGTWNERLRNMRRMGHLRIGVVWKWEHEDRFVMTVTVDPVGRKLRGE